MVGKPLPRVDAYERVSGTAQYPSDILLPGMLYAAILRRPHPHATVKRLDVSEAEKMPGVRAVLTGESREAKDIKWKYQDREGPLFDHHCRFEGEVVAAVAAYNWYQASDAARAIQVEYEVLPFVVDHEKSLDNGTVKVDSGGNLLEESRYSRGDVDKGFSEADIVLEESYRTSAELHTPLEPHGCVANWDRDRLTIWESSQGVYAVQSRIAETLGLPLSKIRVSNHYMGGGFGKLQPGKYTAICALLAKKCARPVKQLLPLQNEPALLFCLNRIRTAGIDEIIVVLGHNREKIMPFLADMPVAVAVNDAPLSQMADSVQVGLAVLPSQVTGIMIGLADHLLVLPSSYRLLLEQHQLHPHQILMPTHAGRGGHPTLFPAAIFPPGAPIKPMNRLIAEHHNRVLRLPVDDPGVCLDMDHFSDYQLVASLAAQQNADTGWPIISYSTLPV